MNLSLLLFIFLVFSAVLLLVMGLENLWHHHWSENSHQIQNRLKSIKGEVNMDSMSLFRSRPLSSWSALNLVLQKIPKIDQLDVFLTQAGLTMQVGSFLWRVCLLSAVSLGLSIYLEAAPVVGYLLMLITPVAWLLYLQHQRRQRVIRIELQLPDTLDLMARAMQAGHAFSSALLMVGSEGVSPIKNEFQITFNEINFGISTESALHHLTHRVASNDLRFFVVAVLIQLETGGNLTEILKSLAALIRDRQRIAGTVRVLTAEGRLSAWILGLLPFALGGVLSVVNHDFISKLWTEPVGIRMLQISLTLMVIGIWWMWQMVRVEI